MDGQETLKRFVLPALLVLSAAPAPAAPPGFVHASGTTLVDGTGAPLVLRGVNLGGWLMWEAYLVRLGGDGWTESRIKRAIVALAGRDEAFRFFRAWRERYVARADFHRIRELGWNCVRLVFNANLLSPRGHFDVKPGGGWAVLDQAVDAAEAEGLYVVLDMHSAPGGQNAQGISDTELTRGLFAGPSTTAYRDEMAALWGAIAARYRGRTTIAAYDLMNEPVVPVEDGGDAAILAVYRRCIGAVRAADPSHLLMVEGNWYATSLGMFQPPALDPNLCYHFHRYWAPVGPRALDGACDLRRRMQAPVWLGETGENCPGWYARCIALAEANGIGWCFWPWKRMGGGCPEGVEEPEAWKVVARALRDKTPLPRKTAAAGLRALADALPLARCREDDTTVAALTGRRPEPMPVPGRIEAENFLPGEGAGYHDADAENRGGACGQGEGVDVQWCEGGAAVGWIEAGEWLTWSVSVTRAGPAPATARYASAAGGGAFRLSLDGVPLGATVETPSTGGWQAWRDLPVGTVNLPAGIHTLRLDAVRPGFNLDALVFGEKE